MTDNIIAFDPDKTSELPVVEAAKAGACTFEQKSVTVGGVSRVTTVCTACGGDIEAATGVHSLNLIRATTFECPLCGAKNAEFGD